MVGSHACLLKTPQTGLIYANITLLAAPWYVMEITLQEDESCAQILRADGMRGAEQGGSWSHHVYPGRVVWSWVVEFWFLAWLALSLQLVSAPTVSCGVESFQPQFCWGHNCRVTMDLKSSLAILRG